MNYHKVNIYIYKTSELSAVPIECLKREGGSKVHRKKNYGKVLLKNG